LNKWKDSIEQKQKAKQRIDLIETEQQKSKDGQAQLLDKIDKLTGKKCNAENAIKTLKNLYEEYSELARDREELANQFSQIKKSLSKYELKEQLKSNVNEPAEFIKELISFKEKKQGEIEIANKNLSAHPFYQQEKLLVEIGGILSQIRNAELKIDHLKSAIDSNKNKQKRFQDELKTIPDSLKETKLISEKLEAEVQQLRTEKELKHLRASLEEHRQNLVNGEPCPLCGSEHHPWAENVEAPEFDNQKLRDKESDWENSKEKLAKLKTQKDNLEQLLSDLENEQNQLKKDFTAFEKQNITAREKLPSSLQKENPEKIEQQRDSFKQMQQNAEQIQKFITEADKMLPEAKDLQDILEKGKSKKEELEKLYRGSEPLHNLMESITHDWEEVRTSLAKLEHEKEQRENEKKQFNNLQIQLEKSLKPELQKLNYEQIEDAIKELLPYATEKHLNEKSQRLRDALAKTKNDLNHFKEQFKNKKAQDIEETKESLKASLEKVSNEIDQLEEKSKALYADIDRQKKNLEFIDRKEKEKKDIIGEGEKWLLLEQQIGDATGNKFSTFAQQLTLEQLILLANKRLEGLSKRYLLAMPVDQGDLVAVDRDMGDQERSVKTLSGGETFLISLALALALSDLASQNIQIESMFIDEGFGTLDPETLDLTLDVLEKLQANDNRMIGIISHVEALKERI
ncbi:MAG: SbcC/MukB-like Walker B domain-containing protein, partial [Chitinophagales bacterium]